ncbi:hypothetical protein, variant 2 [Cryptococcus amylolentus CBS 6039]|uniref:B-related factor 1 n=1 Tax=Cryptococcus amylolentus CBS 6039 TaxID=1295533 RepID=A0A1E3HXI0_9TREE|nr:hypothetical protein, variant 1 [Cryptococcus amylolentus CBS 6039]XP_018995604.1 hypothetical protein, variant 2 [Cryptococcus amylolentus CBS 6039]ODN81037.1 hypothetical protein, variant 1 [Cryptococcus amylolentus CBS 6039]ODN81038.1 hypothetical protein, variant 2 [Cryptococcus amylolentus CBS 6039]
MSSVKQCPQCGPHGELVTDQSAGNVVCMSCGQIIEEGILVSEVGFAEGSGGRISVQGTFVSNYATGVAGTRGGRGGQQNTENIKANGSAKIDEVARKMYLGSGISIGAKRFFSLAVDNKFNRGRKTSYIVASCLYLQCRLKRDARMLIDFSEHLAINVFELGATYLKLRSTLNFTDPMPEVDPAIYNLRFAHRLNFGPLVNTVAADASRLVRRFRADWMTQGRRPAGVCGACIIIAGRMSNFLRTPDEVAQVVKVHPNTIKKRLLEFAETDMAKKTVGEWRALSDAQLDAVSTEEKPPVVKQQARKREKELKKHLMMGIVFDEDEETENGDEDDEDGPIKRAKLEKGKGRAVDEADALQASAAFETTSSVDDEDDQLDPLAPSDYVSQLESARDDPASAREERRRASKALLKEVRGVDDGVDEDEEGMDELEALAEDAEKEDEEGEDEDEGERSTQLNTVSQANAKNKEFTDWDDEIAVLNFFEQKYFAGEKDLYQNKMHDRIKMWFGARDPKEIHQEMEAVKRARWLREKGAKVVEEDRELADLDDEELEGWFELDEDTKQARARMWLSSNGKWLEEEKGLLIPLSCWTELTL